MHGSHSVTSFNDKAQLVRWASYASVSVAAVLIFGKAFAWGATGAVSLQATLIDSLLDAAASIVNLIAIRHSQRPPNKHYRFGYGKVEAIAALGQAMFIAASACWLIYEAVQRVLFPLPIQETGIGVAVMVFAMIVTIALILFQGYVVKKTNSAAIRADSLHYRSDFLINGGVIFSLLMSYSFSSDWFDPIVGGVIAIYIFYTAWTIVLVAFSILMDRELPTEIRQKVKDLAQSHSDVKGIHELRTRSSGLRQFIQLHLELDGDLTLSQSHAIADEVEASILNEFPEAEVLIHQDPDGLVEGQCF